MRKIYWIFLLLLSFTSFSQNFIKFDTLINNEVHSLYFDTVSNSLFVGGQFHRIGNDTLVGIGQYKNGQWKRMGDGVDWIKSLPWCENCLPNPVQSIIRFQDTIYITGGFRYSGDTKVNGIAKWNGTKWKNIGTGLNDKSNTGGSGNKLKIINNELYVGGCFDSINGIAANGLAKFNGTTWSNVHNLPQIYVGNQNIIYDFELYNGEFYVGGTMDDNTTIKDITKWNGSTWVNPGIGIYGLGYITGITTFKNKLYVLGSYSNTQDSPYNPGNCMVSYDGTKWEGAGSGITWLPSYPAIRGYKIYKGLMYLGGAFDYCNGTKINGLTVFDGDRFCSLDSSIHYLFSAQALEFFHDTLFVGGSFKNGNFHLAKVKDYTKTDNCSISVVGLKENYFEGELIKIYPNPTNEKLFIETDAASTICITNCLGQTVFVLNNPSSKQEADLSFLSSGVYYLKIQNNLEQRIIKVIKK